MFESDRRDTPSSESLQAEGRRYNTAPIREASFYVAGPP